MSGFCYINAVKAQQDMPKIGETHLDQLHDYPYHFMAWPYYKAQAKKALTHQIGSDVNFGQLRQFYTQIRYYDPTAEKTLIYLDALKDTIAETAEPSIRQDLINEFKIILLQQCANIDVMRYAYSLSKEVDYLPAPKRFLWIIQGITTALINSGNGLSFASAYKIISLGEESALIMSLRFKALQKISEQSSVAFYTIYQGIDLNTGRDKVFFVDSTAPLTFLTGVEQGGLLDPNFLWQHDR